MYKTSVVCVVRSKDSNKAALHRYIRRYSRALTQPYIVCTLRYSVFAQIFEGQSRQYLHMAQKVPL